MKNTTDNVNSKQQNVNQHSENISSIKDDDSNVPRQNPTYKTKSGEVKKITIVLYKKNGLNKRTDVLVNQK